MLRELVIPADRAARFPAPGPKATLDARVDARTLRLLILHNGDSRLAALETVLSEIGYHADLGNTADDARLLIERAGQPDVLVTAREHSAPLPGTLFARDCLARYPGLRVLYISWLPWMTLEPETLAARERMLSAPFTGQQFAAAIRAIALRRFS